MKKQGDYIAKTIAYASEIGGVAGIAWTESIGMLLCGATLYMGGKVLNKHIDKNNLENNKLEDFLDK